MAQDKEDIIRRGLHRDLPVKLGEDEVTKALRRWADRHAELEMVDNQKSDTVASFARRKAEIEADMKILRDECRNEERIMPVECYERFAAGMIEIVRSDTGEVVDRRPASAAERQRDMDHNFSDTWDQPDDSFADEATPITAAKKKSKR